MARKSVKSLLFSPKDSSFNWGSDRSSSPRCGFSPSRPTFYESVMERTLELVEPLFLKWDEEARVFSCLFKESRREAREFVRFAGNLQRAMQFLIAENPSSGKLIRAQSLMQMAMKRLQKEFYLILSMNRARLDPESVSTRSSSGLSTDDDEEEDEGDGGASGKLGETDVMKDLKVIAECMISSGYADECLKVYKIIRKSIVDEGVYRLGVEKFSASQIHKMDFEAVDFRIKKWVDAVRISVSTLFQGERILCDHVFVAADSIRESCFDEIAKEGATILFDFPQNIVKNSKKSPEKVFRTLDMYSAISDHWPEIDSIFPPNISSLAATSLLRLAEHVRSSFDEFESSILKDSTKSPVSGLAIHSMTKDVMNYLSVLSYYSNVLDDIFADHPAPEKTSDESPINPRIERLILVLLCKLDGKTSYLKDRTPSYSFLENNLRYVMEQVQSSNLKYLLGDEWMMRHETKVKQLKWKWEHFDGHREVTV